MIDDAERERWRRLFELARKADSEAAQLNTLRDVLRDMPGQAVFVVDGQLQILACGGEVLGKHPDWSIRSLNGKSIEDVFEMQGLTGTYALTVIDGYRRALAGQHHAVTHGRGEVKYTTRFWPVVREGRVACAVACTFLKANDPGPVDLSELEQ